MRSRSMLFVVAFAGFAPLLGGCATQLPVEHATPAEAAQAWTPDALVAVSDLASAEAPKPFGWNDGRLLRCNAEGEAEHVVHEHAGSGHAGGEHEHHKPHEVALSLGYTSERGEGGFTIGLDYGYYFNERFGIGPFFDFVGGDLDAMAVGAGIWFRPICCLPRLTFQIAPGLDISQERERPGERTWEVEPLIRLGVNYSWDIGRGFRLGPSFFLDAIYPDKKALAATLTLSREF